MTVESKLSIVRTPVPMEDGPLAEPSTQESGTPKGLDVFRYEGQGVRTVLRDGEPWFVAKDVCVILDIGNVSMAIGRLAAGGVSTTDTFNHSGFQPANPKTLIVNESNLYKLIFQSRKPAAAGFTEWVTGTVLPSIRKTGRYAPNALPDFNDPVVAARAWADTKESEMKALEEVRALALQVAEDAPKVGFFDDVMSSKKGVSFAVGAKALNYMSIGQNRLFEIVRGAGLLMENNIPYQEYINRGYFQVIMQSYTRPDGRVIPVPKTLVLSKGLEYIRNS